MLYHKPEEVRNPKRFIKDLTVLYDGKEDGFSLAVINWEGLDHIGIRWNIAIKERGDTAKQNDEIICHGSPSLNGIPSWFILPRELFNPELFDDNSNIFRHMVANWQQP